jgi:Tfp pilus assembly protein PilX
MISPVRSAARHGQQGIVLFIALIVLVVMSLAGIAMMRQVGTGVTIAGNLAFKDIATSVGDLGVETARAWLVSQGSGTLQTDQAPGYFSSWASTFDPLTHSWASANSTQATADDGLGNEVRYVIHRLCNTAGLAVNDPLQQCVTLGSTASGGSKGGGSYGVLPLSNTVQPYYRITVRVTGPRNTTSYVQAIMY